MRIRTRILQVLHMLNFFLLLCTPVPFYIVLSFCYRQVSGIQIRIRRPNTEAQNWLNSTDLGLPDGEGIFGGIVVVCAVGGGMEHLVLHLVKMDTDPDPDNDANSTKY